MCQYGPGAAAHWITQALNTLGARFIGGDTCLAARYLGLPCFAPDSGAMEFLGTVITLCSIVLCLEGFVWVAKRSTPPPPRLLVYHGARLAMRRRGMERRLTDRSSGWSHVA